MTKGKQTYIEKLNNNIGLKKLNKIKNYAINNNVPIITDDGLSLLLNIIKVKKACTILELGTAIGYSTLAMSLTSPNAKIYTIERNEQNYEIAKKNIALFETNNIEIFLDDALTFDVSKIIGKVDVIFIDAAKSQYIKFFEKYETLLGESGIIICDNLLFHGFVERREEIESRNLRALVRKIDDFNMWLSQNEKYDTTFFEIGDGMSISIKK